MSDSNNNSLSVDAILKARESLGRSDMAYIVMGRPLYNDFYRKWLSVPEFKPTFKWDNLVGVRTTPMFHNVPIIVTDTYYETQVDYRVLELSCERILRLGKKKARGSRNGAAMRILRGYKMRPDYFEVCFRRMGKAYRQKVEAMVYEALGFINA